MSRTTMNESVSRPRRVFIVDDHPIVRQGLGQLLDSEPDLSICGEAEGVSDARVMLRDARADIVIVDLTLRDGDGLELIKQIRRQFGQLPVLVLSMHDENIYAERLLSAGANGYIMKQAAADQLLVALRRVLSGSIYVSEAIGAAMIERFSAAGTRTAEDPIQRLTTRELQVLSLIGRGKNTREVAADLGLSTKTVESHRVRIKKKLHLETSAQLVRYAVNWNLIRH